MTLMPANEATDAKPVAKIAENVVSFGRFLRNAGLPVGPDRITNALKVISLVGIDRPADMHSALSSVMVDRHENQPIFDGAFDMFWLNGGRINATAPEFDSNDKSDDADTPVSHARLTGQLQLPVNLANPADQTDASLSFSVDEQLRERDFASMTSEEFDQASRLVRQLMLPLKPYQSRRRRSAGRGEIDLRRTAQRMLRAPDTIVPVFRERQFREPPVVVLLDISGSMERYARMFLHFTHALTRRYHRVDVLVFGTRLTNISRCLQNRDVDVALKQASDSVQDWHGGTRIASSLKAFNQQWARRLLARNATLIMVTDGLDRDEGDLLERQATRLRGFARQIVWLNPLLRYAGFEPKAAGIRTLLPIADYFLPVHNVQSLVDLASQLRDQPGGLARKH